MILPFTAQKSKTGSLAAPRFVASYEPERGV